jgi:CheY-like chemotaxis protein
LEENKKILVIDDESYIRRVLELKIKNLGYQVMTADNGQDGLAIIEDQRPDVVITDIMMPKLDGKTLCEKIDPFKQERPFLTIVVTARINPDERIWIDRMQDTCLMEKPFSPNKIVEAIEQYLEAKK